MQARRLTKTEKFAHNRQKPATNLQDRQKKYAVRPEDADRDRDTSEDEDQDGTRMKMAMHAREKTRNGNDDDDDDGEYGKPRA